MNYYQTIITEKSWQLLKEINRKHDFILIGGWAVWVWTHALKSKDIDIIIDYDQLAKLQKEFEVVKNNRLLKYEIKKEEVDIDIYLPYYSNLGIPAEEVINHKTVKEGFGIPQREVLLILKQFAYSQRQGSAKGEKDKIDVLTLGLSKDLDWKKYLELLKKFGLQNLKEQLIALLAKTYELKEAGINKHIFAKEKKRILGII